MLKIQEDVCKCVYKYFSHGICCLAGAVDMG